MTDEQWLRRESAALLALLDTCEKPDTWTSIANDCVLKGSAERISTTTSTHPPTASNERKTTHTRSKEHSWTTHRPRHS